MQGERSDILGSGKSPPRPRQSQAPTIPRIYIHRLMTAKTPIVLSGLAAKPCDLTAIQLLVLIPGLPPIFVVLLIAIASIFDFTDMKNELPGMRKNHME